MKGLVSTIDSRGHHIKKVVKKDTLLYSFLKKINGLFETLKPLCLELYIYFRELYHQINVRFSRKSGVLENKREVPVVVSLTTIPERIDKIHLSIETLMKQSLKPDHIILWLSDTIDDKDIPKNINRLKRRGLQVRFCTDIRSYTKIIYTLMEHPKSIIVTADDDVLYPRHWLKRLHEAYCNEPEYIHCHRAHLMEKDASGKLKSYHDWSWFSPGVEGPSFHLFPTGVGGVLYPPGSLHSEVLNKELFLRICPTADDVWLKAMSLLNRVPCKKVAPYSMRIYNIRGSQKISLWRINQERHHNISWNDKQIHAVFMHFGLLDLL